MERWRLEWQSIESRISGLQSTASLVLTASGIHTNGLSYEALSNFALRPTLMEVLSALEAFNEAYIAVLPAQASEHLKRGLERVFEVIGRERSRWQQATWQAAFNATAVLVGLCTEVTSSLADRDALGRRNTERAFEHLQRSIVADESYRNRWQAAYKAGETACERLGAVHLLLHGIWAFKAHSEGERTDLVLQERLAIGKAEQIADTIVLTEWKLAKKRTDVMAKAEDGMRQAQLYSGSSLAAVELASVRYIVVVTEEREEMRGDERIGLVTYRFINVAVSPLKPSVEARRRL
jgi:hypothetical protein